MPRRKKTATPRPAQLKPGQKVVLKSLPSGFLDDLPIEDQRAISAVVGHPVRFCGYDEIGRLELDWTLPQGPKSFISHAIFVDGKCVTAVEEKPKKRKRKRRK